MSARPWKGDLTPTTHIDQESFPKRFARLGIAGIDVAVGYLNDFLIGLGSLLDLNLGRWISRP